MSSLVPRVTSTNEITVEEWNGFSNFITDRASRSSSLPLGYKEGASKILSFVYEAIRDILPQTSPSKMPEFHERFFFSFWKFVLINELSFNQECQEVVWSKYTSSNRTELIRHYSHAIAPFLKTLHKVTTVYLDALVKSKIVSSKSHFGTVVQPGHGQRESDAWHYLQSDEGLIFPVFSSGSSSKLAFTNVSLFSQIQQTTPFKRFLLIGENHRIIEELGFFFLVGQDSVEVHFYSGNTSQTPFCETPLIMNLLRSEKYPLLDFVSSLFVNENKFETGAKEFIPVISDPIDQKQMEILLLEEMIEGCSQPELVVEAQAEIKKIEDELLQFYKEQIEKEQTERKELVISGKIDKINKKEKEKARRLKLKQKQKQKGHSSSSQTSVVTVVEKKTSVELFLKAKEKLDLGRKRVKEHKLFLFIKSIKKIFSAEEFEGLITQEGSHLHIHSEEKEPLTLVIPHKGDRTTPSKILNRFVNRLGTFFNKKSIS